MSCVLFLSTISVFSFYFWCFHVPRFFLLHMLSELTFLILDIKSIFLLNKFFLDLYFLINCSLRRARSWRQQIYVNTCNSNLIHYQTNLYFKIVGDITCIRYSDNQWLKWSTTMKTVSFTKLHYVRKQNVIWHPELRFIALS